MENVLLTEKVTKAVNFMLLQHLVLIGIIQRMIRV